MNRLKYLLNRSILLSALAAAGYLLGIVVIMAAPPCWTLPAAIVLLVFTLLMGCAFYLLYLKPVLDMRSKYRLFSRGKIYEELFEDHYILFPEQKMAMDHIHTLLNKQDAINLTKRQAEYLALQNQINPHFLYNTLEAIRGDALSEGLISIAKTTESLASFFRYTISDTSNLVTLEDELENSENYFTIQQYRFGEKLKMDICIPENEPGLYQLLVPKLTLQPIIENAIFHGLEQLVGDGLVKITFETTVSRLFINIIDNGIGIDSDTLKGLNDSLEQVGIAPAHDSSARGNGIALRNVARRIKLLFGDEYGLHIFSTRGHGTDVRIALPKLSKKDYHEENYEARNPEH